MKTRTAIAALGSCIIAGVCQAGPSPMTPLELPYDADVSVTFQSQSAGATGSLYFLGSSVQGVLNAEPHSDGNGLGQHIFSNHGTPGGTTVSLGFFEAGSVLEFAYLVTNGVNVAPTGSLFRTDVAADQKYFETDPLPFQNSSTSILGIEDIRKVNKSDWDYNDLVVSVTANASAVPTPGTACLLVLSAIAMRRRRTG